MTAPAMAMFRLDRDAVDASRVRAGARAASGEGPRLLRAVADGEPCDGEALGALFLAPDVPTELLLDVARRARRPDGGYRFETFSPLYLTNECDAECRMCGMRRTNDDLHRETADAPTVDAQLDILHRRGLRAVAILTGEYRHGARRAYMIDRAAAALRAALARGFQHVLINIGALEADEYPVLLARVPRRPDGRVVPQVTMCTFQETYDPTIYARFMGDDGDNPRSDYWRRLENFDRAREAGLWVANPGVLLGLNADVAWELLALDAHVRHMQAHGMLVYVSLPRLRRASGAVYPAGVDDDTLCRLVVVLALGA